MNSRQKIGLILGILLPGALLMMPLSEGLTHQGRAALAVTVLMAIWWMTEAVPIYFTAFMPVALFPILGVMSSKEASLNFGNNYVLMLLCGFFLAKAIEVQGLHKRIALYVIGKLGTSRKKILLSFMLVSAGLSMWIANVAVALLMLPIANAVVSKAEENGKKERAFGLALLLGIAYACSLGGTASLIGTPVNMVFAGMVKQLFPLAPEISFLEWLKVGLPVCLVFLPIVWSYLIWTYKLKANILVAGSVFSDELKKLGKMKEGEWKVLIIFILTAVGWTFRSSIQIGDFKIMGWAELFNLEAYVHDTTVVILTSALLFILHSDKKPLLNWKQATKVPWGVVMIVSGGYCIADGFQKTGLANWIGSQLAFIGGFSPFVIIIMVIVFIVFLTEINSNTATANIFLPLLAAIALAANVNPLYLMIPATFACSFAFMMPSGTGTNTVIFASEKIEIKEMVRVGFGLNLISIIVLSVLLYLVVVPVLGMSIEIPSWAK